jgi:hypothetical protein
MSSGKGFSHYCRPRSPGPDDRLMTIGRSSTASCGSCAPGPLGGTCRIATVPGRRWPAGSTAGGRRGSGISCWLNSNGGRMEQVNSTGRCTT